jgi:N-methylhydantoinase A
VPGSDVEIMSYAVVVATVAEVTVPARADALFTTEATPVRTKSVRDTVTGAVSEWAIYDRGSLVPWATIAGPAIVAEDETSTLVGPGWSGDGERAGIYRDGARCVIPHPNAGCQRIAIVILRRTKPSFMPSSHAQP